MGSSKEDYCSIACTSQQQFEKGAHILPPLEARPLRVEEIKRLQGREAPIVLKEWKNFWTFYFQQKEESRPLPHIVLNSSKLCMELHSINLLFATLGTIYSVLV